MTHLLTYVSAYGGAKLHVLGSPGRTSCGRDATGLSTDVADDAAVCSACERLTSPDAPTPHVVTVEPVTLPVVSPVTPSGNGLRAVGALIAEDTDAARVTRKRVDGRRVGIPTGMRLSDAADVDYSARIIATRDARSPRDASAEYRATLARAARRPVAPSAVAPMMSVPVGPDVTRWLNVFSQWLEQDDDGQWYDADTMSGAVLYRRAVNTTIVQRMSARLLRTPLVFAPGVVADESMALIDGAARFAAGSVPMPVAYASAHRAGGRAARRMAEYMRERRAVAFREARERAVWLDRVSAHPRAEINRDVFRALATRVGTMTFLDEGPSDASAVWAAVVARTFLPSVTAVPQVARPFHYWTRNVAARAASEAFVNVRGDHLRIETEHDDVMNLARELSGARMLELLADDDAQACNGTCGDPSCASDAARPDTHRMSIGGLSDVIGWHTAQDRACGECEACAAHKACTDKRSVSVWLPVARIIGASVKGAARRIFPTDKRSGVEYWSAMAARYGYDVADAMTSDVHDAPVSVVAPQARKLARFVAETLAVTDAPIIAGNGQWTTDAGNVAALFYGYEPTARGRRSARARIIAENTP